MSDTVIVHNVDEVYVEIECPESISWELRDAFTFTVPGAQYSPAYRARLWDGKIRLFDVRNNRIYRGLAPHIESFCKARGYTYEYEDESYDKEFSVKEAEDFIAGLGLPHEVRDYQLDAFVHAVRQRRSLLLSPTASGKSLIIYLLLRYINAKHSIVIVPTVSLVNQLASDFADYGFDVDAGVHRVYSGQDKRTDKPITITTWQSVHGMPKDYFRPFDMVIGDEAHQFKAKSLVGIMTKLTNTKHRIGTTGTLDGTKTHKLVLEGLFGPVRKVTTTKELMDQGIVADFDIKCLILKHNPEICKLVAKATYQEEIQYLIASKSRNTFIKNLTLSLKDNTLVLFNYIEHGKTLYELINTERNGRMVFFVYGGTEADHREQIRHIVEKEKDAIIVASYGTFSTGVNIKNLRNVIFASPSKSRIRNLQSIGRSLRVSDTKTHATLYDIADDLRHKKKKNYTLGHYEERLRIYMEEKFKTKVYKIDLKG